MLGGLAGSGRRIGSCFRRPTKRVSPKPAVVKPTPDKSSTRSESEQGSDFADGWRAGSFVGMQMESRGMRLPHGECADPTEAVATLATEDFTSPHLPQTYHESGVPLRKMHSEVYRALRCTGVWCFKLCRDSGSTGPDSKYYCSKHFHHSIAPMAYPPKVKFEESDVVPDVGEVRRSGIPGMADEVVLALVDGLVKPGVNPSDIAGRLTTTYGGNLIKNALEIREAVEEDSFAHMKLRLGKIDVVTKGGSPRPSPVPHSMLPDSPRIKAYSFDKGEPSRYNPPVVTPPLVGVDVPGSDPRRPPPPPPQVVQGRVLTLPGQQNAQVIGRDLDVLNARSSFSTTTDPMATSGTSQTIPLLGACAVPLNLSSNTLPVSAPTPGVGGAGLGQNDFLFSMAHHMGRLANPDALLSLELWRGFAESMRYTFTSPSVFDNYTVALCPGVFGKHLDHNSKSLNDRLRPLYDSYRTPTGSPNRLCLASACLTCGGRDKEEDHFATEAEFTAWAPRDFDHLGPPPPSGGLWEIDPDSHNMLKHGEQMRCTCPACSPPSMGLNGCRRELAPLLTSGSYIWKRRVSLPFSLRVRHVVRWFIDGVRN